MNEENFPAWYQSTRGPGVSTTITGIALNMLPMINMIFASRGVNILPETINFWVSLGTFLIFSSMAGYGYIKSKVATEARIGALRQQIESLGAKPE